MLFTARHNVCVSEHLTEYCVDRDLVDHEEAERACHAVIDAALPRVETAWMDAYSDEKDLPSAAREAQESLFQMGRARAEGDPGMGIDLDVRGADHLSLLRTFASWSIGVELYDGSMRWVAYMSDTGSSVCFNVTADEATRIQASLGSLPFTALNDPHARRRR